MISPGMIAVLRLLVDKGNLDVQEVYTLDQRFLRACYFRGWFVFDASCTAIVTQEGLDTWDEYHKEVKLRQNSANPLFRLPGRAKHRRLSHRLKRRTKV